MVSTRKQGFRVATMVVSSDTQMEVSSRNKRVSSNTPKWSRVWSRVEIRDLESQPRKGPWGLDSRSWGLESKPWSISSPLFLCCLVSSRNQVISSRDPVVSTRCRWNISQNLLLYYPIRFPDFVLSNQNSLTCYTILHYHQFGSKTTVFKYF